MKQTEFESLHRPFWHEFELTIEAFHQGEMRQLADFPQNYRKLCQHMAIANSRGYAASIIRYLNTLVKQGYQILYGNQVGRGHAFINFIFVDFQATLIANLRYVLIAALLFLVPLIGVTLMCFFNDEFIYSLMAPEQVRMFESMYDPSVESFGRERQSDSDLMMFGFYIKNNIGIAFTMFATGIFFCVGSLFSLVFNGIHIGAAMGHLASIGYVDTFFPFVVGHGSFELTAIVFAGAAGIKIGYALLAPGNLSRLQSLQMAAKQAIKIMYGAGLMLLIAAFIEAFWSSSSTLTNTVKYSVGAGLWIFVFYYCFFLGRAHRAT